MSEKNISKYLQIGERMRTARERIHKSQRDVATDLGLPFSTYSNYENGNRTPKLDILQRIAEALEVDINVLISGQTLEERDQKMKDYVAERHSGGGGHSLTLPSINLQLFNGNLPVGESSPPDPEQILRTDPLGEPYWTMENMEQFKERVQNIDRHLTDQLAKLNINGKLKVADYAADLSEQEKYKKKM